MVNPITAVCPGSFDPVTVGHIDIIRRAAAMFDTVLAVVMVNSSKHSTFTADERAEMLCAATANLPNVKVDVSDGLLADYAKKQGAHAIIRGLRAMSDFEYEFQMALANKKLNPDVETVFLTTSAENMYLSSSMVKEIGRMGGDIRDFVPPETLEKIVCRLTAQKQEG